MEKQEKCIIRGNLGHTVPSIHFSWLLSRSMSQGCRSEEKKKKVLDMKMHQAYTNLDAITVLEGRDIFNKSLQSNSHLIWLPWEHRRWEETIRPRGVRTASQKMDTGFRCKRSRRDYLDGKWCQGQRKGILSIRVKVQRLRKKLLSQHRVPLDQLPLTPL